MFGYLYQIWLTWDALRLKNTIQVIGLVMYNVGILIYAAIQYDQISDAKVDLEKLRFITEDFWDEVRPILIALPVLMAFATLLFAFQAWKLYDEFAWTIYKHISADLRLKRRYLTYQVLYPISTHTTITNIPRSTSPSSSSTSFSSSPSPYSSSSSSRTRAQLRRPSPPSPSSSPSSCSSSPPGGSAANPSPA